MKNIYFFIGIVLIIIIGALIPKTVAHGPELSQPAQAVEMLSHQQKVWLGALEWCESRGVHEAVNPNDKDNTPSYYSFQFKPGTFKDFGIKYNLVPADVADEEVMELMESYELTYKIMEHMVIDEEITNKQWRDSLFPGCIKKLGTPPRNIHS